jgi:hypothetical protein
MPSPRILVLPLDHAAPARRWSVASHVPRRSATVYAARKREAQLLGAQVLGVAPDKCIAVDSPAFLESLGVA